MCGALRRRGRPAVAGLVALLAVVPLLPRAVADGPEEAERVRVLEESIRPGSVVSSPLGMVVTSAPEATRAGVRMLEAGGNAIDAAVAAAFTLTATAHMALSAGTTARSQINFASSTAPTSPADGDLWFDGTNLNLRVSGATYTLTKT